MSDTWKNLGEGRLVVRSGNPIGRYLIGVPFLVARIYCFDRYFVLVIVAYVEAGDWRALFSGFIGWFVILAMSAVFLVPGWVLCLFRRVVLIDAGGGALLDRKD